MGTSLLRTAARAGSPLRPTFPPSVPLDTGWKTVRQAIFYRRESSQDKILKHVKHVSVTAFVNIVVANVRHGWCTLIAARSLLPASIASCISQRAWNVESILFKSPASIVKAVQFGPVEGLIRLYICCCPVPAYATRLACVWP